MEEALNFASTVHELKRDELARDLWRSIYEQLSTGKPGLLGTVLGRAEAQVTRISCLYALLDKSAFIQIEHLRAALAIWKYVEDSACYLFGQSMGDPIANKIKQVLSEVHPDRLTTTEIHECLGKNVKGERIRAALQMLLGSNVIQREKLMPEPARKGRPTEVWTLVTGNEK